MAVYATQTREQQLKEITYQKKMLANLKKWMRNMMLLSSAGVALAYWAFQLQEGVPYTIIGVISVILIVVCVVLSAVIGLALKNGRANVEKILRSME